MLTVTDVAARALLAAIADADEPDDRAIRVQAAAGADGPSSLRLAMDDVRPDDKKIEFEGRVILVAQPDVADLLEARTLSVEDTAAGAAFRLRPTTGAGASQASSNGGQRSG